MNKSKILRVLQGFLDGAILDPGNPLSTGHIYFLEIQISAMNVEVRVSIAGK